MHKCAKLSFCSSLKTNMAALLVIILAKCRISATPHYLYELVMRVFSIHTVKLSSACSFHPTPECLIGPSVILVLLSYPASPWLRLARSVMLVAIMCLVYSWFACRRFSIHKKNVCFTFDMHKVFQVRMILVIVQRFVFLCLPSW